MLLAAIACALAGCGGSDTGDDPVIVTDVSLLNSIALAQSQEFEDQGLFGTRVANTGGRCRGGPARWQCTLDIQISERVRDRRLFAVTLNPKGCWVARQTGTDVGATGAPSRPARPLTLRDCLQ